MSLSLLPVVPRRGNGARPASHPIAAPAPDGAAPEQRAGAAGASLQHVGGGLKVDMIDGFVGRFPRSEAEFRRALKVIPEGTTQARTPSTLIVGAYPIFGQRGKGAYVWDVDGNRYIDWILSFGTIVLGHSHPVVNEAVIREIEEGFALPLTRLVQTELAELLVKHIPCAEKALFVKSGSEATSAAIRLARIATGRDEVIR